MYIRSLQSTSAVAVAFIVLALCTLFVALYISWLKHCTLHKPKGVHRCGLPELVAPALQIITMMIIIVIITTTIIIMTTISTIAITADLGKYMNRSTSNSGGSSSGSGVAAGVVGSSVAPPAYGIPFMEQPHSVPSQSPSLSQGDLHICLP